MATTYTPLIKKQIKLYKKYGITNYTIVNNKITINSSVHLDLTTIDVDTFKNVTIKGYLSLVNLTKAKVGSFNGLTIHGSLYLNSLTKADVGLFDGLNVMNGLVLRSLIKANDGLFNGLYLNDILSLDSLTITKIDTFKNININGWLHLDSLSYHLRRNIYANFHKILDGYNKERGYCYFDGILRKVVSVKQLGEYTIYLTPFDYVVQKGDYTAHARTIEEGISDVSLKILAEEYQENLTLDTKLNKQLYRLITGACELGTNNWINKNNIQVEEISVKELIPLLEKTNAYGLNKIKSLVK